MEDFMGDEFKQKFKGANMDYNQHFQQFSHQRNTEKLQSLSPVYTERMEESEEEKFDVAWLFAVLRRRAPIMLFVAVALSILGGALIVRSSRNIVPVYKGSFKLLVEPITAEGRLARQYIMAQGPNTGSELQRARIEETSLVDYQTLIRVLRSPKLMEPAIAQLQAKYPKIRYGPLVSNIKMRRITVGKGANEQGTKILVVSYQDPNPEKVEVVLNHLVDAYLEYSLQERMTSLRQGIKFINDSLPELREKVDTLQADLQKLRQQYNLMNPDLADRYLYEHSLIIQRQRVDLIAQLQQQRTLYANLQTQLREDNPVTILSREPKAYETLIGQIQKLETEMALQSALFLDDSEPMVTLREKLDNLYLQARQAARSIVKQVESQLRELEAREQSLAEAETALNQKLRELPLVSRQYADLQRELEVATNSLQDFLSKREALRVDAARNEVPWELIDPPNVPRDAAGNPLSITVTQTKRQLAVVVILSSLLAIGVGFLVEVLHTVFHTPAEVKAATKLPVLGVIPFAKELKKATKKPKKLAPANAVLGSSSHPAPHLGAGNLLTTAQVHHASALLEAFRALHTNIRLLSSGFPIHSFVIAAAEPGDGKSSVALQLAHTAAAIGQRVLLVDADLRSPQIHTQLNIPNLRGLSDAISTDISLNDIIQRPSDANPNLFVLTSGSLSHDPIKLLSSKKMHSLMEQFQDFFDVVIYNSPPLLGLADGSILASQTDGLILVVGLAKTDRSSVKQALDGLKISGSPVLGVVTNQIKG
ncbi:GumC family protein [Phormidium sp. CCY1219]|uniref:GumC family protein n=1 Tax=Phormidium sp. CCY1219 TaxID=2886104 RepID=UPI002D1F3C7B|nr:polysaccharide biosynthesis tyrosine autokinase [Phormidium sp. CCY1219]MEB3829848.1 polysaccharide biosynthesis tyrosine autokinase [Phormidium sp. CCY1219]